MFEPEESWICRPQHMTFQTLVVDSSWLRGIAPQLHPGEPALPHFPGRCFFDPGLSETFRELATSSCESVSRLQREELVLRLFARLLLLHGEVPRALPRPGWEHPAVKRAKEYLQSHYADEVPLRDLAKIAYLSPFHLTRVFRQAVGIPPHAYQMQLRLQHARTLLARGLSVGHVAQETGFYDQGHFTRQFRRHFFVRPSLYGKAAKISSSIALSTGRILRHRDSFSARDASLVSRT